MIRLLVEYLTELHEFRGHSLFSEIFLDCFSCGFELELRLADV